MNSWNWSHTEIEVYWTNEADFAAKNTSDRITHWNTFYYNSKPSNQQVMDQHGVRILQPKYYG